MTQEGDLRTDEKSHSRQQQLPVARVNEVERVVRRENVAARLGEDHGICQVLGQRVGGIG